MDWFKQQQDPHEYRRTRHLKESALGYLRELINKYFIKFHKVNQIFEGMQAPPD
jgi:hypothetical protein